MTAVIGLDLSIDRTGIALPSGQLFTFHPKRAGDLRLKEIESAVRYYVVNSGADVAAIEKIPESLRGGTITIMRLGMVHGIVRKVLAENGVPFGYVPVPTLKKYATGSGTASKQQMIDAARDVGIEPADDNEADAAWLRLAGIHRYDRISPSPTHALSLELISGPTSRVKWPDLNVGGAIRRPGRA